MKSLAIMLVASMAWAVGSAAAKSSKTPMNRVMVYCDMGPVQYSGSRMGVAEWQASNLFKAAGVELVWRDGAPKKAEPDRVVAIRFVATAPQAYQSRDKADVLANAQPYGAGLLVITVFGDRVTSLIGAMEERAAGRVLGHVLAHELGHVLEGVARHSESGLMKARWTTSDLGNMGTIGLPFNAHDVDLLRVSFGGTLAMVQK